MQITDEMVEAAAKIVCAWLNTSWDGLSDRDISDKFPDWAYPVYGPSLQGGKPALRKIMRAALEAALGASKIPSGENIATALLDQQEWLSALGFIGLIAIHREVASCIEDLAEALRPFAAYISLLDNNYTTKGYGDDCALGYLPGTINAGAATVGDLRRARAVLERWGLK